jgi:hypothetical protein
MGNALTVTPRGNAVVLKDGFQDPATYLSQLKEINDSILNQINISENKGQILDILDIWGKIINNTILFTFMGIDLNGGIPSETLASLSTIKDLPKEMSKYINEGHTDSSSSTSFWG